PRVFHLRGIFMSTMYPVSPPFPVVSFLSGDGWMRIRNTSKCCLLSHSPITAFGPGLRIGAFFRFPVGSSRIPRRVENEAAGKGGATGKMEGIRQPNTPAPAGERKEQHGTGYGRRFGRTADA